MKIGTGKRQVRRMEIKDRIEMAISRSGRSQVEIGKELGVSQSQISAWTKGTTKPYWHQMVAFSKATGVSLGWLGGEDWSLRDLTEDERFVLYTYRNLRISKDLAFRRLHGWLDEEAEPMDAPQEPEQEPEQELDGGEPEGGNSEGPPAPPKRPKK